MVEVDAGVAREALQDQLTPTEAKLQAVEQGAGWLMQGVLR